MNRLFSLLMLSFLALTPAFAAESAQDQVAAAIKAPNVSVVHLWAPWCSNCKAELKSGGWGKIVKDNPQVKFYFVSVWDKGDDGRALLAQNEIANQPNVTIFSDAGPRGADHIKQFAGLAFSWIPTTWVFKGGDLRYAMNYGEIRFPILQQFITDSSDKWEH